MAVDLVTFLRARLDEDELVARSACDDRAVDGERWKWVHRGDPLDQQAGVSGLVDQPVNLNLNADSEPIGVNGPDFAGDVYLSSVEEYSTCSVGALPTFAICCAEEVRTGAARHIARHDPARVLAEVATKRRIVDLYEATERRADDALTKDGRTRELDEDISERLAYETCCKLLALLYADHPDCDNAWI